MAYTKEGSIAASRHGPSAYSQYMRENPPLPEAPPTQVITTPTYSPEYYQKSGAAIQQAYSQSPVVVSVPEALPPIPTSTPPPPSTPSHVTVPQSPIQVTEVPIRVTEVRGRAGELEESNFLRRSGLNPEPIVFETDIGELWKEGEVEVTPRQKPVGSYSSPITFLKDEESPWEKKQRKIPNTPSPEENIEAGNLALRSIF